MFYITLECTWHTDRWNPSKGEEGDGTGTIVVPIEANNATDALRHLTASLTRIVRARRVTQQVDEARRKEGPMIPGALHLFSTGEFVRVATIEETIESARSNSPVLHRGVIEVEAFGQIQDCFVSGGRVPAALVVSPAALASDPDVPIHRYAVSRDELTRALLNVVEAYDRQRTRPASPGGALELSYALDAAHVDEARNILALLLPKVTP